MAAEPGAKSGHPPITGGRPVGECALQNMKNKRTADVANFLQNRPTEAKILVAETQTALQRRQHVSSPRMPDPRANRVLVYVSVRQCFHEKLVGVGRSLSRDLRGKQISQQTAPAIQPQQIPLFRTVKGPGGNPLDRACRARRPRFQNGRPRGIGEQTGTDQHAGVVVEIKGGAADLNRNGQHAPARAAGKQSLGSPEVGQCGAASLSHQIERKHCVWQTQPFTHVTGQTRTEIAGASTDDDRVNGVRRRLGILHSSTSCRFRQCGRMMAKPGVECVRVQFERFLQLLEHKMTSGNPALGIKDLLQQGLRSGRKPRKRIRISQCLPAFFLRIAVFRDSGPQSGDEHRAVYRRRVIPQAGGRSCRSCRLIRALS